MNSKYQIDGIERSGAENPIKKAPGPKKKHQVDKKRGRPPKNMDDKLTKRVSIVLTKDEYTALQNLSETKYSIEMPMNTLIRLLLKEAGVFDKN
jgi:hypothetical protein